jgi:hypothetical protein
MRKGRGPTGRLVASTAAMVCLAAQACSLAFTPPTVRVAEVRISSVAFTGGSAQVDLEVENPNGYALESRDFRYALAFDAFFAAESLSIVSPARSWPVPHLDRDAFPSISGDVSGRKYAAGAMALQVPVREHRWRPAS